MPEGSLVISNRTMPKGVRHPEGQFFGVLLESGDGGVPVRVARGRDQVLRAPGVAGAAVRVEVGDARGAPQAVGDGGGQAGEVGVAIRQVGGFRQGEAPGGDDAESPTTVSIASGVNRTTVEPLLYLDALWKAAAPVYSN